MHTDNYSWDYSYLPTDNCGLSLIELKTLKLNNTHTHTHTHTETGEAAVNVITREISDERIHSGKRRRDSDTHTHTHTHTHTSDDVCGNDMCVNEVCVSDVCVSDVCVNDVCVSTHPPPPHTVQVGIEAYAR
eukprot:GHVR01143102.1.p1 GENE.GHVR01143102.1~~GHVR01143102.1.p1  ORF type:complete len:132 (+),score=86.97 GHVR01143102.1:376-771(+)